MLSSKENVVLLKAQQWHELRLLSPQPALAAGDDGAVKWARPQRRRQAFVRQQSSDLPPLQLLLRHLEHDRKKNLRKKPSLHVQRPSGGGESELFHSLKMTFSKPFLLLALWYACPYKYSIVSDASGELQHASRNQSPSLSCFPSQQFNYSPSQYSFTVPCSKLEILIKTPFSLKRI